MPTSSQPAISIVVPVHDEEGAAPHLAEEIAAAFAGEAHEIIFVDDASRDGTRSALAEMKARLPQIRVLVHGANAGQSRALRTGILAARGAIIVTLDGDGQNDPAYAPRLVARLRSAQAPLAMVGGRRVNRQDTAAKRWASRFGNGLRKALLDDGADDTGCGLKAFWREAFLRLPYFDHMHRYLPALMLRDGYGVAYEDVGHRPRQSGRSKYTNWQRGLVSIADLFGVLWLRRRARLTGTVEED